VLRAYDLSDTNVVARFMALYPPSGRVVSAAAGRVTTSRDTLERGDPPLLRPRRPQHA
jgi:hypothetical protein